MAVVTWVVPAMAGVLALVTLYRSVVLVEEGDLRALLVFGEFRAVLRPGVNVVPPFVSETYPVDPETMTYGTGSDRESIPGEYRDEVERHR